MCVCLGGGGLGVGGPLAVLIRTITNTSIIRVPCLSVVAITQSLKFPAPILVKARILKQYVVDWFRPDEELN